MRTSLRMQVVLVALIATGIRIYQGIPNFSFGEPNPYRFWCLPKDPFSSSSESIAFLALEDRISSLAAIDIERSTCWYFQNTSLGSVLSRSISNGGFGEFESSVHQFSLCRSSCFSPLAVINSISKVFEGKARNRRRLYAYITDEVIVNTSIDGTQHRPFPLVLTDNTQVVVWASREGTDGMYAQIFDKDWNKIGSQFQISQSAAANTYVKASGAVLNSGSYVVAWTSSSNVYARMYNKNASQGDEFKVNTSGSSNSEVVVCALSNGGFAVTWARTGIYMQIFDYSGNKVGSEITVRTYSSTSHWSAIRSLANGNIVVAWYGIETVDEDIFAQIYDLDGNIVKSMFLVSTSTAGEQIRPYVTSLKDGRFVITWQTDGSDYGIDSQIFDSSGNTVGSQFRSNEDTASKQSQVRTATLNDEGFILTWSDNGGFDGSGYTVIAQRYDKNGNASGSNLQVNAYTSGNQELSTPATTKCGFAIAWHSQDQDGDGYGIIARAFYDSDPSLRRNYPLEDLSAYVYQPFSFTVPVNTFHSSSAESFTFSAHVLIDGKYQDMDYFWLTFDQVSRTFTGTPTEQQTLVVQVGAHDGCGYEVEEFTITVSENSKPVANALIPNQLVTLSREKIWEYYVPKNAFKDLEGDPIVYTGAVMVVNEEETALNSVWNTLEFDTVQEKLFGIPNLTGIFLIRIYADDGIGNPNPTPIEMTVEIVSQGMEVLELYQIIQRGFKGFITSDDYHFWVANESNLKRFDLSSDNPFLVSGPSLEYDLPHTITALVEIPQNRIAVADDQGNVRLLSSSSISEISTVSVNEAVSDIYNEDDDYIYISHGSSVSVIQFTSGTLELSLTNDVSRSVTSIAKTADIIYAATGEGLYEINTLTNTVKDLAFPNLGYVYDIVLHGNYLYVLQSYEFWIVDISDTSSPSAINKRTLENLGTSLEVTTIDSDTIVFISEGRNGMNIFNVNNPENISTEGYYESISRVNTAYISKTGTWGIVLKEFEVFTLEIFRRDIQLEVCDTDSDPCTNQLEIQAQTDFSKDVSVLEFLPTYKPDFIYLLSYTYSVYEVSGTRYKSAPNWLSTSKVDNKLFRLSGQAPKNLVGSVVDLEVRGFAFKSDGERLLTLVKIISLSVIPKHASLVSLIPDQSLQVGQEWLFSFSSSAFSEGDDLETEYYIDSQWIKSSDISFIKFFPLSRQWRIAFADSSKETLFGCDPCDDSEHSKTYVFKITAKNSASDSDPGVSTTFSLYIYSGRIPDQKTHPGISGAIILDDSIFPTGVEYTVSLIDSSGESQRLPWWMSYIANERKILVFPSLSEIDQDFDIRVSGNNNGADLSSEFQIQVRNDPPVAIEQLQNQRVKLGTALDYSFSSDTFSDPDKDVLSYIIEWKKDDGTQTTAIPSWISFSPNTFTFYGSPSVEGSYILVVNANDGLGGQASIEFVIEAYNNPPYPNPESSIQSRTIHIGTLFTLTLPSNLFTDADGDSLSYTSSQSDGLDLPSWLTFNPSSLHFSGTPSAPEVIGTSVSIQITATDGFSSSSSSFAISVANFPPQASSVANQTVHIGKLFSLSLPSTVITDADGDVLAYTVDLEDGSPLPSWLIFNTVTLSLSGTPVSLDLENSSIQIKISASDGYSWAETSFSLNITNSAPQSSSIEDQWVHIGNLFSLILPSNTFTDQDSDSLTYSVSQVDDSPLPTWLVFNSVSLEFSGTPRSAELENTSASIKIIVSDGYSSAGESFSINITNTAPQAGVIESQSVHIGSLFTLTLASELFTDQDGDSLEYTVNQVDGSPLPVWLTFNPSIYQFSGTPSSSDIENTIVNIKVSVSDGYRGAEATFSIAITNQVPVLTSPLNTQISLALQQGFIKLKPGIQFQFTMSIDSFTDNDGDVLTYSSRLSSGDPLPEWLSFDPNTYQFYGTPNHVQSLSISVTASDGYASASDTFDLAVTNILPTLNKPLQAQFDSLFSHPFVDGFYFSFQFSADTFIDEDDSLVYSAVFSENRGDWRSLEFSWVELEGRTFSGTVSTTSVSNTTLSLQLTASDGQQTISDSFLFTVLPIFPSSSSSALHIESLSDSVEIEVSTNGPKIAVFSYGTLLVLDISNNEETDWKIEGSPSDANYVLENVKYRPSSDRLLSESKVYLKINREQQEYPISVFAVQEPAVSSSIPNQDAYIGNTFSLGITKYFNYSDQTKLTYSFNIDEKPTGYKDWLNFESGIVSGIPTDPEDIGSYKVTITVTDEFSESKSESFSLEVDYTQIQKFINTVFLIGRYIGPGLTIVGAIAYRTVVYNYCMRNRKKYRPLELKRNGNNIRELLILRPDEEKMALKIYNRLPDKVNFDEQSIILDMSSIIRQINQEHSSRSRVSTYIEPESTDNLQTNNSFGQSLRHEQTPIIEIKGVKYRSRFLFFCVKDYFYKRNLNETQRKSLKDLTAKFKKEALYRYSTRLEDESDSSKCTSLTECKDSWTAEMPDLTKSLECKCDLINQFFYNAKTSIEFDTFANSIKIEQWRDRAIRINGKSNLKDIQLYYYSPTCFKLLKYKNIEDWLYREWFTTNISDNGLVIKINVSAIHISDTLYVKVFDRKGYLICVVTILSSLNALNTTVFESELGCNERIVHGRRLTVVNF